MTGALVKNAVDRAFPSPAVTCLALRHGHRIIGSTVMNMEAAEQFTIGPCILSEYRNRGFGTPLLATSLEHLRAAGLARAIAITCEGAPAARFLYPKFGGQASVVAPSLAA